MRMGFEAGEKGRKEGSIKRDNSRTLSREVGIRMCEFLFFVSF